MHLCASVTKSWPGFRRTESHRLGSPFGWTGLGFGLRGSFTPQHTPRPSPPPSSSPAVGVMKGDMPIHPRFQLLQLLLLRRSGGGKGGGSRGRRRVWGDSEREGGAEAEGTKLKTVEECCVVCVRRRKGSEARRATDSEGDATMNRSRDKRVKIKTDKSCSCPRSTVYFTGAAAAPEGGGRARNERGRGVNLISRLIFSALSRLNLAGTVR